MADFPKDLLKKSIDERLSYFEKISIKHTALNDCFTKLISSINNPINKVMFIFGPTGVGKSELIKRTLEVVENNFDYEKNIGQIPYLNIECIADDKGKYDWTDFYSRALISFKEPMMAYKKRADYRKSYENALRYRKPKVVVLDEAQHIAKVASGRILKDQLDVIKSIANLTETLHILVGTYELIPFLDLSGQLSRRTRDIHFKRYNARIDDERQDFLNVILNFQSEMPLQEEPDLLLHWEFLYERSLGCVGILKNWLYDSLKMALDEGCKTLTIKHLKSNALSISQCDTILQEILRGEKTVRERNSKERTKKFLSSLGLDDIQPKPGKVENQNTTIKKSNRKAFERSQGRDPVGRNIKENMVV